MARKNFDQNKLCKTTGWNNNCGLNCLAHFLVHLLETDKFENQALLNTFAEYYQLPKTPSSQEIKTLLNAYPVPTDKEAILALVLRKHLGKILEQNAAPLWELDAAAAISDLLADKIEDIAGPFYAANKKWLDKLKADYNRALRRGDDPAPLIANAKAFWLAEGAKHYAEYIGDSFNAAMISADHLSLLTQQLNIGLEVYTPQGLQNKTEKDYPFTLKVYNRGSHWVYEEPTSSIEAAAAHNRFYPETFYDSDPALSGEFKAYGGRAGHIEPKIRQSVASYMMENLSHQSMDHLLDVLKNALNQGAINDTENQEIFEFYFNGFENELKKQDKSTINRNAIKTLADEINADKINILRSHKNRSSL